MIKRIALIGFAEALSAPEVAWSLADQGFQVIAFARRGRRSALHHSRHVTCCDITPPEADIKVALSDLRALMVSLDIRVKGDRRILFPLDDAALWLCSQVQIDQDWILAGPRDDKADLALDKYLQLQAARNAGFNVPKTSQVATADELFDLEAPFPLILKPSKSVFTDQGGLHKAPNWICGNREELSLAAKEWAGRLPLLVQPFFLGIGEGIFGLASSEGIKGWSAHRRMRMMNPHGSGSSACISQEVPEDLKIPVTRWIENTGWHGLFMIELLRDQSGTPWFMELNGRPWGSMALARRQGLEYPAWHVQLVIDPTSIINLNGNGRPDLVCRHVGRELLYPFFVLRGPKSKALGAWPSFWKALREVIRIQRGESLYNWRKDDPKVLIYDCYYTFHDQVFKFKR
jgi:hypothetical protein